MKLRDLLGTAAASLWRNKGRTILTVLATLIGAFTIALTLGIRVGVNFIHQQAGGQRGRKGPADGLRRYPDRRRE